MKPLRLLLLVFVALCPLVVAADCQWWEAATVGDEQIRHSLVRSPAWSPPRGRPLAEAGFSTLSPMADERVMTEHVLNWETVLYDFVWHLWVVLLVFGLLYLYVRDEQRDRLLNLCLSFAVGLPTLPLIFFFLFWIRLGDAWGPTLIISTTVLSAMVVGIVAYRKAAG